MIFVDSKAKEINLPAATRVEGLESWTGADLIISRLSMPMHTRTLLQKHVDEGALLIQLKYAEDLAASVGDRLNESIARMRECTRRTSLHWLLFIGTLACDAEGYALINGRHTHTKMLFNAIDGALVGWIARGGVYYALPRETLLPAWCDAMQRRLAQYEAAQYKFVYATHEYPDAPGATDDPLQLPVRVRDGRVTLISLPGLGFELCERIWNYTGSLKAAFSLITDVRNAGKVEGVGKGKIEKIRQHLGLEEGEYLCWQND